MPNKSTFLTPLYILIILLTASCGLERNSEELVKLSVWSRGIKLQSRKDTSRFAYIWFYEWHMFDAVKKGEHTPGSCAWKWSVNTDNTIAQMTSEGFRMTISAERNGASMILDITNTSDYDWPEIAAIIPCFNPGGPFGEVELNKTFLDDMHEHTYFVGNEGLALLKGQSHREIHFNHEYYSKVLLWEKEQKDGNFVFSDKWPTSPRDAYSGLIVRESDDRKWVIGIAWESFLSAQGYNPWRCMHLSIRVGPLRMGETKTIRGKMYLFEGSKDDCFGLFNVDFRNQIIKK